MRLLDRINRTGTTVVMATHDHAIVDAMRRRVMQLERGRIVRDESRGVYEGPAVTDATPTVNNLAPAETNGQQAPSAAEAPRQVAASPELEASPQAEDSQEVVATPGEPDEG
jgi:cell division transport system ATP-binding protein